MLVSEIGLQLFVLIIRRIPTKIASEELEERLDVDFYRRMNSN